MGACVNVCRCVIGTRVVHCVELTHFINELCFNQLLANELRPEGIRVNCLAPGLVRTRFAELLWKGRDGKPGLAMDNVERATFLRRAAEPYEMAGAICFACSDDSSYMTGEVMLVHGGGAARL